MATIGTSYRDGPAMRMSLEQIEKDLRRRERGERRAAIAQLHAERQRYSQRVVDSIGVDHPVADR